MNRKRDKLFFRGWLTALVALSFLSCTQIQKPTPEPFFAATAPPTVQEFRWSNGKRPKSFDPARAAAAPEADIVRAICEGLTELDARSLDAVPAVAQQWSASDDNRVWTFNLREGARWSNGKRVTANDFVASWKRLLTLGEKTAHRELLQNIVGFANDNITSSTEPQDFSHTAVNPLAVPGEPSNADDATLAPESTADLAAEPRERIAVNKKIGVEAIDDLTLKVTLELPDKDFPKLVAHQIFRPIYGDGVNFEKSALDKNIVTNGAFVVVESTVDGVVIERSNSYWNKAAVQLERIRFVAFETAEAALDAYKEGEIDAVTNAQFKPLALKLLAPYDDFRRTTHSALNFYEFNLNNPPFGDRRVREALAAAIDRERLIETELEGTAQSATDFLPHGERIESAISFDVKNANDLLEKAGYGNGEGFPQIRLVINRNDTQQRVAVAVAKMWKQHLNIETEIVPVELTEIKSVRDAGDFDLIRRGVVLPTTDETVGLTTIFRSIEKTQHTDATLKTTDNDLSATASRQNPVDENNAAAESEPDKAAPGDANLLNRADALFDMFAIPLYFPKSYSLVKPYVYGFETNLLDAPSIKNIGINDTWQPPNAAAQN